MTVTAAAKPASPAGKAKPAGKPATDKVRKVKTKEQIAKAKAFRKRCIKKNLKTGLVKYKSPHVSLKRIFTLEPRSKPAKKADPKKKKKPLYVIKPFGADGKETRRVFTKKRTASYPTANRVHKPPSKQLFKDHKRNTRSSLTPGKVCILLAGKHQGKRVVLLKVLPSGLLLVNGPFKLNACPMRRIHQNYVIGTTTKIDIKKVKLPEHINDKYFERARKKKTTKKEEGEIFAKKVERYRPSEERKKDQADVDKQVIAAIKQHKDKKMLFKYLKSFFALRSGQYPHHLKF